MLRVPVHHRRGRMPVDVVLPAADQREPLILQFRTGGDTSSRADSHGFTVC